MVRSIWVKVLDGDPKLSRLDQARNIRRVGGLLPNRRQREKNDYRSDSPNHGD
jgi:hypothetical protein